MASARRVQFHKGLYDSRDSFESGTRSSSTSTSSSHASSSSANSNKNNKPSSTRDSIGGLFKSMMQSTKGKILLWFCCLVVLVLLRTSAVILASSLRKNPVPVFEQTTGEQPRGVEMLQAKAADHVLEAQEQKNDNKNIKHVTQNVDAVESKQVLPKIKSALQPAPEPVVPISREKGILIALDNAEVEMAVSLIKQLRCLGNHELVQVYHCFEDSLSEESKQLLREADPNIEIVDVCLEYLMSQTFEVEFADEFRSSWLKPLALYHTNVQNVLIIDPSVVLLQDPAVVRELPSYQETGTMFFHDRVLKTHWNFDMDLDERQLLYKILDEFDYEAFNLSGYSPSARLQESFAWHRKTSFEQESSMVFIDKARAQQAMSVLYHLITSTRRSYLFSTTDQEVYWLAYEIAHMPYSFSPWGMSAVSSTASQDMWMHPDTLCGALAQFVPSESEEAQLLYVKGKELLDPYPVAPMEMKNQNYNTLFNTHPAHVTPRQVRRDVEPSRLDGEDNEFPDECLVNMGSEPIEEKFFGQLLQRRMHFFGLKTQTNDYLHKCIVLSV